MVVRQILVYFVTRTSKFDLMLNRALELGATHMVTGHYAQVNYNEENRSI